MGSTHGWATLGFAPVPKRPRETRNNTLDTTAQPCGATNYQLTTHTSTSSVRVTQQI